MICSSYEEKRMASHLAPPYICEGFTCDVHLMFGASLAGKEPSRAGPPRSVHHSPRSHPILLVKIKSRFLTPLQSREIILQFLPKKKLKKELAPVLDERKGLEKNQAGSVGIPTNCPMAVMPQARIPTWVLAFWLIFSRVQIRRKTRYCTEGSSEE